MKSRLSLFLASLTLLASLSGCTAMLPIAGALVLKEAADRYEAMSKPQEAKPEPAETVVAAVPDDAAPEIEAEPAVVTTHVASTHASKSLPNAHLSEEPLASAEFAEADDQLATPAEPAETMQVQSSPKRRANPGEHTDEEIEASRNATLAQLGRDAPSTLPTKSTSKPSIKRPSKSALAAPSAGAPSRTPDATAADQKAREITKATSSIPTTEAAANESATDSAARILATALKRIPNPQATPATKPAPITPQKAN